MKKYILQARNIQVLAAALVLFSSAAAQAQEPDLSYDECFKMAQKAVESEMIGLQMEADTVGDQGIATPATLPPSASNSVTIPNSQTSPILPGLQGTQDFEQALRDQGARIVIDPEDPTGAPKVELDNVQVLEPQAQQPETPPAEEATENTAENAETPEEPPLTSAELFEMKRSVCRIKYGIAF